MGAFFFWLVFDDLPPLSDLRFLPPMEVCAEFHGINSGLAKGLALERSMRPHLYWEFAGAISDCEDLARVWNCLEEAHRCHSWDPDGVGQRRLLGCVRDVIGPERYYSGRIPPVGLVRWIGD